ncbi:hypothetical protein ACFE04_001157 [Oxalis oulophora]
MSVCHRHCRSFLVICIVVLGCLPGVILSAVVTLDSMSIFHTHDWFKTEPKVYFSCKGENMTELPDVKNANEVYTFKGEESWQPLTEFTGVKCKRCGLYEKETIKSDDVFDEWEFCPSDFDSDGKYTKVKEKEFNATFLCAQCGVSSPPPVSAHHEAKWTHIGIVILISIVVSAVMLFGTVIGYKYWQKRKRQQDQARFLKLFEDEDDMEDELSIGM